MYSTDEGTVCERDTRLPLINCLPLSSSRVTVVWWSCWWTTMQTSPPVTRMVTLLSTWHYWRTPPHPSRTPHTLPASPRYLLLPCRQEHHCYVCHSWFSLPWLSLLKNSTILHTTHVLKLSFVTNCSRLHHLPHTCTFHHQGRNSSVMPLILMVTILCMAFTDQEIDHFPHIIFFI